LIAPATLAELPDPAPIGGPRETIPSVDWWITSRCNLACDFCYGPVPSDDPVYLRAPILKAIARSSTQVVTFCGGEPLLVRPIDQYAETLTQLGKRTVLNTNGELLPRRYGRGLKLAAFSMVGISIEGSTPEVHREMRGERADLDEVMEAVRLVAKEPAVRLKLATVVSRVNRDDLPALARVVRDLGPDVWRLYQYSRRGNQNIGQFRHRLTEDEFEVLVREAASLAAPVVTAPSTEAETEGCLIVDPSGNVLLPIGNDYRRRGNCLEEPLDRIWARTLARPTIISNKRWLSVLGQPIASSTASGTNWDPSAAQPAPDLSRARARRRPRAAGSESARRRAHGPD
jgi:MoaA/NifB/PqqE/SkfB family radical SAM enzyme